MNRDAAPEWPLKSAWRDTRDAGRVLGRDVPSFPTVYLRWQELGEAQRLQARPGGHGAGKLPTMPAHRDKSDLAPWHGFRWTVGRLISGLTGATEKRRGP